MTTFICNIIFGSFNGILMYLFIESFIDLFLTTAVSVLHIMHNKPETLQYYREKPNSSHHEQGLGDSGEGKTDITRVGVDGHLP